MRIKFILSLGLSFLVISNLIAQFTSDTVYFNEKWKKTHKSKASYYRIIDKLSDGRFKYSDYWISGEIQSKIFLSSMDPEIWDGDCILYNKNGTLKETSSYKQDKSICPIKRFDTNGMLDIEYINNLDILDNKDEMLQAIIDFEVFVKSKIIYPENAKLSNIQGQVMTAFYIDPNGHPYRISVTHSVCRDLDNEAIRIIKLYTWPAPVYQGNKTMIWVALPITFNLI
jgi:TonB family protein